MNKHRSFALTERELHATGPFAVRATHVTRKVYVAGELLQLQAHLKTRPVAGTYELEVKANQHQVGRVVEVKESDPPRGQKPLQWVLYTSHPVTCWHEALTVRFTCCN